MTAAPPAPPSAPDDALRAKADAEAIKLFLSHRDAACPGCGYNLRGLTGTACPECGRNLTLTVESERRLHVAHALGLLALATPGLVFAFLFAWIFLDRLSRGSSFLPPRWQFAACVVAGSFGISALWCTRFAAVSRLNRRAIVALLLLIVSTSAGTLLALYSVIDSPRSTWLGGGLLFSWSFVVGATVCVIALLPWLSANSGRLSTPSRSPTQIALLASGIAMLFGAAMWWRALASPGAGIGLFRAPDWLRAWELNTNAAIVTGLSGLLFLALYVKRAAVERLGPGPRWLILLLTLWFLLCLGPGLVLIDLFVP